MKKKITIFGSTGSIGDSTLDLVKNHPEKYEIVGGICETSDVFGKDREFSSAQSEDLIAILDSGAYGSSMSNEYNSRNLIPEILVKNQEFKIIRRRPSFDEMIRLENDLD